MKKTHFSLMLLIWQAVFVIGTLLGMAYLLPQNNFLGGGYKLYSQNPLLYSRGNFDGIHYVQIAKLGYGYAEQTYFPLYSNLIRYLDKYISDFYLTGVLISLGSFVLALIFLVKLLRLDYNNNSIFWIVLGLLIFPTSFFFGAVYAESLFFLLVILAFYCARKGQWLLAGVIGALAAYTRFVGIFLFPALMIEWWLYYRPSKTSRSSIWQAVFLLLIPAGLLFYMNYLQMHGGDALAFLHTLPQFGTSRNQSITMLYQVFWRYTKMLVTVDRGSLLYSNVIMELAIGVLFLVLSVYSFIKLRLSYAIFSCLCYLTPTLTGSFVSLPRYVLACFPGFILIGLLLEKYPSVRILYMLVCSLAFLFLSVLFTRGYWVA